MDTGPIKPDSRLGKFEAFIHRGPKPGTRLYLEKGEFIQFRQWFREVKRFFKGDLIPYEWVAQYVGVTRAALHKRVTRGHLTVLSFMLHERTKGVFGDVRNRFRKEYRFLLLKEVDAWSRMLSEDASLELQRKTQSKNGPAED